MIKAGGVRVRTFWLPASHAAQTTQMILPPGPVPPVGIAVPRGCRSGQGSADVRGDDRRPAGPPEGSMILSKYVLAFRGQPNRSAPAVRGEQWARCFAGPR